MASLAPEEKLKFLISILKNIGNDGTPDLQAVAVERGDKRANVQYQYEAIIQSASDCTLDKNRVVPKADAKAPATPSGTKKKASKSEKADTTKATTPEPEKAHEPPITPKSADAEDTGGDHDEDAAAPTTPKTPTSTASQKRGRPKKDAADGEDVPKSSSAKKPRKTKKQKEAEEKAAKELGIEEGTKGDDEGDAKDDEVEAKEELEEHDA